MDHPQYLFIRDNVIFRPSRSACDALEDAFERSDEHNMDHFNIVAQCQLSYHIYLRATRMTNSASADTIRSEISDDTSTYNVLEYDVFEHLLRLFVGFKVYRIWEEYGQKLIAPANDVLKMTFFSDFHLIKDSVLIPYFSQSENPGKDGHWLSSYDIDPDLFVSITLEQSKPHAISNRPIVVFGLEHNDDTSGFKLTTDPASCQFGLVYVYGDHTGYHAPLFSVDLRAIDAKNVINDILPDQLIANKFQRYMNDLAVSSINDLATIANAASENGVSLCMHDGDQISIPMSLHIEHECQDIRDYNRQLDTQGVMFSDTIIDYGSKGIPEREWYPTSLSSIGLPPVPDGLVIPIHLNYNPDTQIVLISDLGMSDDPTMKLLIPPTSPVHANWRNTDFSNPLTIYQLTGLTVADASRVTVTNNEHGWYEKQIGGKTFQYEYGITVSFVAAEDNMCHTYQLVFYRPDTPIETI